MPTKLSDYNILTMRLQQKILTWSHESVHFYKHLALVGESPDQVAFVKLGREEDANGCTTCASSVVAVYTENIELITISFI